MAEPRRIKTRIIQKHAQAATWDNAKNFVPLEGELIVFDKDSSTSYPRLKIGDGSKTINELPFITAGTAEKLVSVRKITLAGAIGGQIEFDGSNDVIMNTSLNGSFEFEGNAAEHKHDIDLADVELSGSYTPSGTISGNYTPAGSVSAPTITIEKTTQPIRSLTSDGSYIPGQCSFPTLSSSDSNGTVTLSVSGGSYTPGVYIAPTYNTVDIMIDAAANSSNPVFTGESKSIDAVFNGTSATITVNGEISGETANTSITPTGTVDYSI